MKLDRSENGGRESAFSRTTVLSHGSFSFRGDYGWYHTSCRLSLRVVSPRTWLSAEPMPQRMTSFGLSGRSNREKLIAKTTVTIAITTHQEHYGTGSIFKVTASCVITACGRRTRQKWRGSCTPARIHPDRAHQSRPASGRTHDRYLRQPNAAFAVAPARQ